MKGKLILENGKFFNGKIFGETCDAVGEIYFNTSMSGYQEMLTDPSLRDTMMVMTYPMIGNYGLNTEDMESGKVQLKALIVKEDAKFPNNFRCEMTLDGFLRQYGVTGFKGIDTRYLTQIIRENGSMKALITSETLTKKEIQERFDSFSSHKPALKVGVKEKTQFKGEGKRIGILDLGVKRSTVQNLKDMGLSITLFPTLTKVQEILDENLDILLISNGPGNPNELKEVIENIKKLIGKLPIFGEILGHQLLALALGGTVEKLKYGHRGSYPVKNLINGKILTTSQNTAYVVKDLPENIKVTYEGINIKTIEGLENEELKITGVQFEPEIKNLMELL